MAKPCRYQGRSLTRQGRVGFGLMHNLSLVFAAADLYRKRTASTTYPHQMARD